MNATDPMTPATHNGIFTVTSAASGSHRTFRIKTQRDDSTFAPGERVVALLTGADNSHDCKGFGFIKPDGRIIVWKKHRGTDMERFARMLERLDAHEAAGHVQVQVEGRCRRCNRRLTTPESVAAGIGPVCDGRD